MRSSPCPIPHATAACSPRALWRRRSGWRTSRQASTTCRTCWGSGPPMTDILDLDATAQLQALTTRQISAVELLDEAVRRHQACHAQINAVVTTDLDRARQRAKAIDEQRAG